MSDFQSVYNTSKYNYNKLHTDTYSDQSPPATPTPTPADLKGLHASLDQQDDNDFCMNGSNLADRILNFQLCVGYQSLPTSMTGSPGTRPDQASGLHTVLLTAVPGNSPWENACYLTPAQYYPGTFPYHLFDPVSGAILSEPSNLSCSLGYGQAGHLRFSNNAFDKKGRGADLFGDVGNFGSGNGTDHYFRVGEFIQPSAITTGKSLVNQTDPFPLAGTSGKTPPFTPDDQPRYPAGIATNVLTTPMPTKAPSLLARNRTGLVTDTSVDLTEIDQFNYVDYLFVATPTDLEVEDFTDPTSKGRQYIPWRVDSKESCLMAINPSKLDITDKNSYLNLIHEGVERGSCNLMSYSPFLVPADDNPDSTNDDPSRQRFFPICVLQEGP